MDVSFLFFFAATALSLVKVLLHIYLGASVKTLVKADLNTLDPVLLAVIFVVPVLIVVPVAYYFWKELGKKMKELRESSSNTSSVVDLCNNENDIELADNNRR
jgi:membrane protein DedA with SNARE-associated domain